MPRRNFLYGGQCSDIQSIQANLTTFYFPHSDQSLKKLSLTIACYTSNAQDFMLMQSK